MPQRRVGRAAARRRDIMASRDQAGQQMAADEPRRAGDEQARHAAGALTG
jgi:hypothetical protein